MIAFQKETIYSNLKLVTRVGRWKMQNKIKAIIKQRQAAVLKTNVFQKLQLDEDGFTHFFLWNLLLNKQKITLDFIQTHSWEHRVHARHKYLKNTLECTRIKLCWITRGALWVNGGRVWGRASQLFSEIKGFVCSYSFMSLWNLSWITSKLLGCVLGIFINPTPTPV